jgi:RNA polymerase sigma-70 factor (ECF subfamily)
MLSPTTTCRPLLTRRLGSDESELLDGLLADDPAAWRSFNERYARLLYRCITRVTIHFAARVSSDDVQEIYANLCVQLLANDKAKLRTFDPARGNRLGSWLGLLATHCTYDYLRSRRREPRFEEIPESLAESRNAADPFSVCAQREQARIVVELMETFSDKDRRFIELFYGEALAPDVIARRLKISVKTVYSKKHKIQGRLESLLQRRSLAA